MNSNKESLHSQFSQLLLAKQRASIQNSFLRPSIHENDENWENEFAYFSINSNNDETIRQQYLEAYTPKAYSQQSMTTCPMNASQMRSVGQRMCCPMMPMPSTTHMATETMEFHYPSETDANEQQTELHSDFLEYAREMARKHIHESRSSPALPFGSSQAQAAGLSLGAWEEDLTREDFFKQWKQSYLKNISELISRQDESWLEQRNRWEQFEANGYGYEKFASSFYKYRFAENNPYLDDTDLIGKANSVRGVDDAAYILYLEAEVQHNQYHLAVWEMLAQHFMATSNDSQTIAALQVILSLSPRDDQAMLNLATHLSNENCMIDALEILQSWRDCHPVYSQIEGENFVLSELTHTIPPKFRPLLANLLHICKSSPESITSELQLALGLIFKLTKQYSKAIDCLESALSFNAHDAHMWNICGSLHSKVDQTNEAMRCFNTALVINERYYKVKYNLAICHIKRNEWNDAQRLLSELMQKDWNEDVQQAWDLVHYHFSRRRSE